MEVLDDAIWSSLTGAHAGLAIRKGAAVRYPAEVAPFAAVAEPSEDALSELAGVTGPGGIVVLPDFHAELLGAGWERLMDLQLTQMICESAVAPPETSASTLCAADAEDMLALAEATKPGPFGPRTVEMGRYLGIRERGRLVAMAGERLKPAGCTEVSAVCTDPAVRGRGLANGLVAALASEIQARGELPFLHVAAGSASEATATGVYERLGFRARRRVALSIVRLR